MEQLLDLRKQYTLGQLSYTQKQDLRMKIVDKIHLGSKLLELDLVARESDGQSVNTKTTSAVHIYDRVSIIIYIINLLKIWRQNSNFVYTFFCDFSMLKQLKNYFILVKDLP